MECPRCKHVSPLEAAKFCSECGHKLSSLSNETAPDKSQDESQSSSNIPHGTDKEKTDLRPESKVLDYQIASASPTGPNEDINNSNSMKKKNQGSSVDSPVKAKHSQEQQQSAHGKKNVAAKQKYNESKDNESQSVASPKRNAASKQQISPSDRLTIYFHAVLSKDFSFNPEKDLIRVRAGGNIGNWENDLVELSVLRDLGEHGFLVGGKYVCKKTDAEAVPIPYKYVVYKEHDKNESEFCYEYIYKSDSKETTNRCLFVKSQLLNDEGEWHQYDDIICSEPSKNVLNWLMDYVQSKQGKIIKGREIAGAVMLETIFDLLRSWSKINLSNFFCQLRQFYDVYGKPCVFEKKMMKWGSLNYGEKDVRKLLKEFMLKRVTPELQRGNQGKSAFIKEPLKAALIMLYMWKQYSLDLDSGTLSRLCTALCLPNLPKEEFLSFWTDITESFPLVNILSNMVDELIKRVRADHMSTWIIVIPLLHLLKGTSKPFQPVYNQVSTQSEQSWAGLQGLKAPHVINDKRVTLDLMKEHRHLLEVDRLLARSWMCLMTVDELIDCNSIIHAELLDILQIFIMKSPKEISNRTSTSILKILEHIQIHLIEGRYSCPNEDYGIQCIQAACKLLQKMCKEVRKTDIPLACVNVVASVSKCAQTTQQTDSFSEKTSALLGDAKQTVRAWIGEAFRAKLLNRGYRSAVSFTAEIEMWNNIIAIDFMSKDFTKEWRESFTGDFEGKYQQEDRLDRIQVYCSKIEELNASHPLLVGSVEKCALQAVTAICQKMKAQTTQSGIFPICCHTGKGADEKLINQLSEDAKKKFDMAISLFTDILNQFVTGKIKIKLLNHILQNSSSFFELLNLDCFCEMDTQYMDTKAMERLLDCRQKEVNAIYHEISLVDTLITMCRSLQEHGRVDFEWLENKRRIDIDEMNLDKFVDVHLLNQTPSTKSRVLNYFELEDDVRSMAEVLNTFKDSYIFKVCWMNEAAKFAKANKAIPPAGKMVITLRKLHSDIFKPCYNAYKDIYTGLKDGSITFKEIDVTFRAYKGKYKELAAEFATICKLDRSDDQCWVQTRIHQIEQYHELHLAIQSAEVVTMVKETLCLTGDFQVLEKLLVTRHENFKMERLDSIDDELVQAKIVLVDITESRRLCLQELSLKNNFVLWVKKALTDINELKVFVDLASISAGENDLEVDRVACFHDAVLGYSSMLYDLKPDADFNLFKRMLKKLWKALDNDPYLPKKLCDSARHIEWLKTVKDSHGSVEMSSLSLASAINMNGVYIISAQNQKLCLEGVLKLHITEEHDEGGEPHTYSLEDLRDLQNKLMLMSGKGDQGQREVNRFAEVFSSVQRLASAYIDLSVAGNPLFREWEAKVKCNSNEACIIMHLHLGNDVSVIVEGEVTEQLPEVCKKMESCLHFWKAFMDKQRSQHYYLNYFTAEQVVYLCSQLTQINVTDMKDEVLMMLSFIKPNCSLSDLTQAWHKMSKMNHEQNDDLDFQTFVKAPSMDKHDLNTGEPCLSFDNLANQLRHVNGSEKLDVIWNSYMRDMNNFLPHFLDVRNLGYLLEILANSEYEGDSSQDGKTRNIQRELPKGMLTGNPNLVICPYEEILITCISVYMRSEKEPLPTYDEVLLCSASTQYEEVELFLRRCLSAGYGGKKIYTMLYADQLTYEVSYKVEQCFQQQKAQSRKDYRLVLVCSSNREHAYLPSAFSQFRLHLLPQEPIISIQRYLVGHFTVPADVSSAAAVFKDRQCVGAVFSERSGVGKSLYIKRIYEKLKTITKNPSQLKSIRLMEPRVDENVILQSLHNSSKENELSVYHFDITTMVKRGLHEFLFRLLILGYLMDSEGNMWKNSNKHLYVFEILRPDGRTSQNDRRVGAKVPSSFLDVFPSVYCRPPKEIIELEMRIQEDPSFKGDDPLMDDQEFRSEAYQRTYQYLRRFHNGDNLDSFKYQGTEGTHVECLQMLFIYCGIIDPSWAELRNFAWFLNLQLKDCEDSVFCDVAFVGDILFGFKKFVVDFMILMAKDFATPSLSISDQSPGRLQNDISSASEEHLAPFRIRKRWESEPHPYIFFNDDHVSMTFIGFHLQPNANNGIDAVDPSTKRVIKQNIMTRQLYDGLKLQRVPFNIDFDQLPRWDKIEKLSRVLGIQSPTDPDETYELTTDNMLKMLAIHMRFRCGIPVIIMGETGCGKTRLIKFLCEMHRGGVATENMKLVKVHGGTSSNIIYTKVREAESMASKNKKEYGFDSVLFFDEANTTEAISSIKEVLCDNTAEGQHLTSDTGLQIIAACNPYRKHTDVMIKRLESAGLGYRVRAEETDEKLGSIPLRQLVYRVHALPPSMIPLVWDFGQLNDHTEKMYIKQIVERVVETHSIDSNYITTITDVLSASQKYMRTRQDECSFVSLRDVERCMQVFGWFYKNHSMLLSEIGQFESIQRTQRNEQHQMDTDQRNAVLWSIIMAVGVCYHACLEDKENYRIEICRFLPQYSQMKVMEEISVIQDVFLNGVRVGESIARNNALKENVFMMVICIELRIPLFLVGKPGSSKSLSKTLVADGMQGQAAHSDLFKRLKQIHLVSFQCSPHSTPNGIINTFKQCTRFQEGKNLKEYVSVVVLDEIGLAEDSQKMPLKTLHPLLEEGCIDDQTGPHKKVGFIGISNWALDPAKMNRGITVSRGDPDEKELIQSAEGICSSDAMILEMVRHYFQPFSQAYLNICNGQGKGFFGLRDYYSLIKMMFAAAKASNQKPSAEQTVKAVLRNFSGKDNVDAVTVFTSKLNIKHSLENISAIELVRENITAIGQNEECRYLLVLTKNYAALRILQQMFFSNQCQPEIIFGSSFPKDQEYTQICRNINRVKVCMETGQTIVLLNLQNLYESLYDALNQYYVWLGGQKYVDLGLGTHRVKCRVHRDFRLIVIEEKDIVYKQFPIPLINRLEKHCLDINTVLKSEQKVLVEELEQWIERFIDTKENQAIAPQVRRYLAADAFIGYNSDTCASVVLQVTEQLKTDPTKEILDEAKLILLNCATPDAVVRLDCTSLPKVESEHLSRVYFQDQKHGSFADFILSQTQQAGSNHAFFTEVTTFSRLLTAAETEELQSIAQNVELLSLQQFDTENSFLKKIKNYLENTTGDKILIIQTNFDEGSQSLNIIGSAKYSSLNEINKFRKECNEKIFVYFITKLSRMEGGTSYVGFHGGPWKSVHIDDLRISKYIVPDIKALQCMTISELFTDKAEGADEPEDDEDICTEEEKMELEDNTGLENVLDTKVLVRSCVQSAVGMLTDQTEAGARSTKRVEILLMLLADNETLHAEFMKTLKKSLHSLLKAHDENTYLPRSWVIKEALNIDALQEAGTFSSEKKTILVQNYIAVHRNMGCTMPFSWRIKDCLEDLWVHALQREGHTLEQFEELFREIPLGTYISEATQEMQKEFFHRYLQDFISMTLNVTLEVDLELLHEALTCGVNELRGSQEEEVISLPLVHAAYHHFKNRIQNLYRMIIIQPEIAQTLLDNRFAREGTELVLDLYAAVACIEWLEPRSLDGDQSLAWLRCVKKLQVPIELVCCEESQRHYGERSKQMATSIQHGWRRIYCLALFVEHMLLGVEDLELRPLVLDHTRHLAQVLEQDSDLKKKQPFDAVITVLKSCKDEASQKILRGLISENALFRKQCNAFFIDLVSTVCFRDNTPPSRDIILHLLSLIKVEVCSLPQIRGQDRRSLTNTLSPFNDSVEKNPVVHSVVLKLLLKYSFDDVKNYLQQNLTEVEQSKIIEETNKTELYSLYINCLEDSMYDRAQWHSEAEKQACLQQETCFLQEFLDSVSAQTASIEHLQQVARVRLCLDMAADLLVNRVTNAGAQDDHSSVIPEFLNRVVDLCCQSRNDWYRVYLIRKICSLHGIEYVQKLLPQKEFRWLFPQEILESDCNCTPMKKAVYVLMALFREVTSLYRNENPNLHPKPEQCSGLQGFIRSTDIFVNEEVKAFAEALVNNRLHALRVQPQTSDKEFRLVEVTVHMAAVLLCGNLPLLQPLQQLALSPNNMTASFIPTMPDGMLAVAQQAMGHVRWYFCPNGHPCTVGECGQPTQISRCLECKAEIGGTNHIPVRGFQAMQTQREDTESGHILGDAQRRDHPDMQDTKNMSPAPFALLRLFTHMSMLLGAGKNPQSVLQIIKPAVLDPGPFLVAHLLKDMEQLSRALGKGVDDTDSTIHLIIHSLLEPHPTSQWPVPYDQILSTKDARNGWENAMNIDVITHQLKDLDYQLKEVSAFIREDERVSSNPVMKLTFGKPELFLCCLPQNSLIHNSSIWSCRRKVSMLSLAHIVEQNNGRDTLPILWRFLQRDAELRLVRFLPDILVLQRDLVKKFLNMTDLNFKTIGEFLDSHKEGEIKLPAEYTLEDLGLNTDLQVLLPQRHGLGLCSTALVSHLITLHNDLVYTVEKHTGEESGYTVSPADLTELHVIRYECERDLLPLILSNCQYSMGCGQETLMEYDLPKIQHQIITRFLQGKPRITLTGIPTLVNRQDRNYEIIFKDVKSKVQQEPLQPLTQHNLVEELQSYSDVHEALLTVELALGFLALTGGEPHVQLGTYLTEVLKMTDNTAPHIFKALSRCGLKHCVALWQLLSSLKSETMIRLKRDPFESFSEEYKHPLQEEHKTWLNSFCSKSGAGAVLLEIHEFLLLVLKNPNATHTFRPDWSLKDTVVSYMERKNLDFPPEVDEFFPEEILLSRCIDMWKYSVSLRKERNQS
ncbi:E3 ubiquitin-protein ligase rnf213-alpha [Anabarilius grahami]|uniref:RING-type E3 ubiquitin transferase n=1 Tax=Anabarilius grahami TaxID=495550 RepID=A0A3N0YM87_ANAGA|nr:E3 ubiquitin-protein ligase rnf213-alpha [Anabarilius grahami]